MKKLPNSEVKKAEATQMPTGAGYEYFVVDRSASSKKESVEHEHIYGALSVEEICNEVTMNSLDFTIRIQHITCLRYFG